MFYCSAPFLGLFVCLILFKIDDILKARKIKKLEEEMRARGMDENKIFIVTRFLKL